MPITSRGLGALLQLRVGRISATAHYFCEHCILKMSYSAYESVDTSPYANGAESAARDLEPAQAAVETTRVNQAESGGSSFDDVFDDPSYRAAQSTFYAPGHKQMPHGQTHYRGAVTHTAQGLPDDSSSAHWGRLPTAHVAARLGRVSYDFTG